MENRFLELERPRTYTPRRNGGRAPTLAVAHGWAYPFAATDRALVILVDNGGVDLGIPALVDKLIEVIPGGSLIPDSVRRSFVTFVRDTLKSITDNLLETAELTLNRYSASKPDIFGDVFVLRDGTASYAELKSRLLALASAGKIVDVFVLTHGSANSIAVAGGIDSDRIVAMKTELGKPLTIRAVYMMNCVGSTLNQAWLDAGAKVSSGSIRNNYLPEPTMYFFWENWKAGQSFEAAVTGAYRKTINLMNDAVRGFLTSLPIPGAGSLAASFDIESFDFVKDSAPVIQGQRSLTITTDALSVSQSRASSLATTVLPVSLLRALGEETAPDPARTPMTLSARGVELIKQFEGFRAQMYNDPVGHCTIGYGTLLHRGNCDGRSEEQPFAGGVTQDKATELLRKEAAGVQRIVNEAVKVPLNQNQNDALVSFVYNVGGGNFRSSTLLKKLNAKDYAAVPVELQKWTKARENGKLVDLPGLVARRKAEAELFERAPEAANGGASTTQSLTAYALTDSNSPQSEQSLEVRRRIARSVGLAEAGGRFDLVHDDSNRVNFGIGSWTGSRIADVLDTYEQVAGELGARDRMLGYFGGQAAFDALRQRFRTQGTAATASQAERSALRRLGQDVPLQEAQIRHLANDVKTDLDSIGNTGNPWYPFIDGGMGAISEIAAHVLVHAKHQAGSLSHVLNDAIAHFGGEATLGQGMVAGTITERQFLEEVAAQIVRRVQASLQAGVRRRYERLFADHGGSTLAYYFTPAN